MKCERCGRCGRSGNIKLVTHKTVSLKLAKRSEERCGRSPSGWRHQIFWYSYFTRIASVCRCCCQLTAQARLFAMERCTLHFIKMTESWAEFITSEVTSSCRIWDRKNKSYNSLMLVNREWSKVAEYVSEKSPLFLQLYYWLVVLHLFTPEQMRDKNSPAL